MPDQKLRSNIESLEPLSPAAEAGLRPGDHILALNGHPLQDIIDYQFYFEEGANHLEIERDGRRLAVQLHAAAGADPGISFSTAVFDRVRTCRSRCIFCFVDQLPRGLRAPLYLKDDDCRLSFLYGNFITLGNLRDDDIGRILNQRLSPLYISVHAADPELRSRLMGTSVADAARGLDILRRLGKAGIKTHVQVVLCPGTNDGAVLEQTVIELSDKYPNVGSVGVVPVAVAAEFPAGHAGHSRRQRKPQPLRPVTPADCEAIIRSVTAWQKHFRHEREAGFVYAADEFYLRAGLPLPPVEAYDDFPHYENGVGIAASFMTEAGGIIKSLLDQSQAASRVFLLSGELAAGLVRDIAAGLTKTLGVDIRPLAAGNRTFGPHVTVTGLLGGKDILDAAQSAGLGPGDLLLIPRFCVNDGAAPLFIDDMSPDELKESLGCGVII